MNYQDAAKSYFKKKLGVSSGSYAELATRYWKGLEDGTIPEGGGDTSQLEADIASLTSRVEALEQSEG